MRSRCRAPAATTAEPRSTLTVRPLAAPATAFWPNSAPARIAASTRSRSPSERLPSPTNTGGGSATIVAAGGNNLVGTSLDGDAGSRVALGAGNDTVVAWSGDNTVTAGAGNNLVGLGTGNNTVFSQGADTIVAGAGNDTVGVDAGNVLTFAGSGHLTFINGSGASTVVGASTHACLPPCTQRNTARIATSVLP